MELTEQERDRFRGAVYEMEPVEQMGTLLTLNKLVEQRAAGRLHEVTQYLTTALIVVLGKHAPDVLDEALEEWSRDCADEDLGRLDAMATTSEIERLLAQFVDDEEGNDDQALEHP